MNGRTHTHTQSHWCLTSLSDRNQQIKRKFVKDKIIAVSFQFKVFAGKMYASNSVCDAKWVAATCDDIRCNDMQNNEKKKKQEYLSTRRHLYRTPSNMKIECILTEETRKRRESRSENCSSILLSCEMNKSISRWLSEFRVKFRYHGTREWYFRFNAIIFNINWYMGPSFMPTSAPPKSHGLLLHIVSVHNSNALIGVRFANFVIGWGYTCYRLANWN